MEFSALVERADPLEQGFITTRDQDIVALLQHAADYAFNLRAGLAAGEYHFRQSVAQCAMMVDLCVTQVLVRQVTELVQGVLDAELASAYTTQHLANLFSRQVASFWCDNLKVIEPPPALTKAGRARTINLKLSITVEYGFGSTRPVLEPSLKREIADLTR